MNINNEQEYGIKELFDEYLLYKDTSSSRKYEIREKIVEKTMGLVRYVTHKYAIYFGINISELNSYGYEGLLLAIDCYDPSLGYMFSSFAVSYIKSYAKRGLREIRGFARCKDFYGNFIKCKVKVENDYSEKYGYMVSIYDNPQIIDDIIELMIRNGMISRKYKRFYMNKLNIVYHDSYEAQEQLTSDFDLEDYVFNSLMKNELEDLLETLTDREQSVLRLRYGFDNGIIRTYDQIGMLLGVSRETIRTIEDKALTRLRHPSRAKKIRDFYY